MFSHFHLAISKWGGTTVKLFYSLVSRPLRRCGVLGFYTKKFKQHQIQLLCMGSNESIVGERSTNKMDRKRGWIKHHQTCLRPALLTALCYSGPRQSPVSSKTLHEYLKQRVFYVRARGGHEDSLNLHAPVGFTLMRSVCIVCDE